MKTCRKLHHAWYAVCVSLFDDVARRQFGVLSRAQAVELLGPDSFRRAVRTGRLVRCGPGAYRCAGSVPSLRQRALAACLAFDPPVALSHRSAAVLWGFEAVDAGPQMVVSMAHNRSGRRQGIETHRVQLEAVEVAERWGIPVTSAARTLLDLAAVMPDAVLERCVDDALRLRHVTVAGVTALLDRADRRSRPGALQLRELLSARRGTTAGDSVGVDRVIRWLAHAGLPAPTVGLTVLLTGQVRIIDLAYPVERIAIEYNGWEFHQMRSRMDADHIRTTELELAGWLVIVVTAAHDEQQTVDRIARALALRGWEASGKLDV
jgi:hypothetical protein